MASGFGRGEADAPGRHAHGGETFDAVHPGGIWIGNVPRKILKPEGRDRDDPARGQGDRGVDGGLRGIERIRWRDGGGEFEFNAFKLFQVGGEKTRTGGCKKEEDRASMV